jgi:Phosphodiester glycosidase
VTIIGSMADVRRTPVQRMLALTTPRWRRTPAPRPRPRYERLRPQLSRGARTTLHVARFDLDDFETRVVVLEQPLPLVRWCRQAGVGDAVVGGFFVRATGTPLGEVRIDGRPRPTRAFDPPWNARRACLYAGPGGVRLARRDELADVDDGDLLQAGPALVRAGRNAIVPGEDGEGFSAGAHQFDSDITAGRYPRAALARCGDQLLAVACDGRSRRDAGMTLAELADALVGLGADEALNLDGGGSASLVLGGRLRNRPREEHGVALLEGRPIVSAVVFEPRGAVTRMLQRTATPDERRRQASSRRRLR